MRPVLVVLCVLVLAGCGPTKHVVATSTQPLPTSAVHGGTILYGGGAWAVVVKDERAFALQLVGRTWHVDRSGRVKVAFLGPASADTSIPQVAASLSARTPLIESGLWVDGVSLDVKGGGLTSHAGTIYGAPARKLRPGDHLEVAYARTDTSATAVARIFHVR